MFVAGVDGCHAPEGWVAFKVELPSLATLVEVFALPSWLRNRPGELTYLQCRPEKDARTGCGNILPNSSDAPQPI
jgi:hypothetical protein